MTLIANLLQRRLTRQWSFSGLATMVRIVLMYYINLDTFFEKPDEELKIILQKMAEAPPDGDTYTISDAFCKKYRIV